MKYAKEILVAAEQALSRADAVRLAATLAVEKAREALMLESAGEAAELVQAATLDAEKLVKEAEQTAMEAFESAALVSLARKMAIEKTRKAAVDAMALVDCNV